MRLRDLIYENERTPLAEAPDPLGGADPLADLAPGTGGEGTPDPLAATPAEAQTPETQQGQEGPIPYSRFKEVNERRKLLEESHRPYSELEQQGYGADDLHRLVAWELEFVQDPANAWLNTAETIMDQLPEPVREAIAAHKAGNATPQTVVPPGQTPAPTDATADPPEWSKPLFEDMENRKKREAEEAERATLETAKANSAKVLDSMTAAWRKLDEADGIATPDETILSYIIAASHHSDDPREVLLAARGERMKVREADLGTAIKPSGGSGPRPVPSGGSGGGGAVPRNAPPKPKTLGEASRRALAALKDGAVPVAEED